MDDNSPQQSLLTPPEVCVSAIERGILHGDVCEVRRLVADAVDAACIGEDKLAPLHIACREKKGAIVQMLLNENANPNVASVGGWTPLHFAAKVGDIAVMDMLVRSGATLDSLQQEGWTPLHVAADSGHVDAVSYLLSHNANVCLKDARGSTAIDLAKSDEVRRVLSMTEETRQAISQELKAAVTEGDYRRVEDKLRQSADANYIVNDKRKKLLHCASRRGFSRIMLLLLLHGAEPDTRDDDGFTPLHDACKARHKNAVTLLLDHDAEVNVTANDGTTPLHIAAENNEEDIIRLLLSRGADVQAKRQDGKIPQELATEELCVEILRAAGSKPSEMSHGMLHSCSHGDFMGMMVQLEHGADVAFQDERGRNALHYAASTGNVDMIKALLSRGMDVNVKDINFWTPLHLAARENHVGVAALLIDRGADVNAEKKDKWTPLHIAALNGHERMCSLLIQRGASLTAKDEHEMLPLQKARSERVRKLIHQAMHDPEFQKKHEDFLDFCMHGNVTGVKESIEEGVSVNHIDSNRMSGLHHASRGGHKGVVRVLLDNQADPNMHDSRGWTSLHYAARLGDVELSAMLLHEGADIDAQKDDLWTALHLAAFNRYRMYVVFLLTNGADASITDKNGRRPEDVESDEAISTLLAEYRKTSNVGEMRLSVLSHRLLRAGRDGSRSEVVYLLNKGVPVNHKNAKGWTALHFAARSGFEIIGLILIEAGADVNAVQENGWSALHLAAFKGHDRFVDLLLRRGANALLVDVKGRKPIEVCENDACKKKIQTYVSWRKKIHPSSELDTELLAASKNGKHKDITKLIEKGASVDVTDHMGNTPLHLAVLSKNVKSVVSLLDRWALPNQKDASGILPLHVAASVGSKEICEILVERGADVNVVTPHQWAPLHIAARNGHFAASKALLLLGASPQLQNCDGKTAMEITSSKELLKFYEEKSQVWINRELLSATKEDRMFAAIQAIDAGGEVSAVEEDTFLSPLHHICRNGHTLLLETVLRLTQNVDLRASDHWTPLHYACRSGKLEMVTLLVGKGADVNAQKIDKWTPLHLASYNGHVHVVKYLLKRLANPALLDKDGKSPFDLARSDEMRAALSELHPPHNHAADHALALAIQSNNVDRVRRAIQDGADVNAAMGATFPLLEACRRNRLFIANVLIENGANVDIVDANMWTPLHYASRGGFREICQTLLSRGACVDARKRDAWTPLQLAAHNDRPNVVELLLLHGANVDLKQMSSKSALDLAPSERVRHVILRYMGERVDPLARFKRMLLNEGRYGRDQHLFQLIQHGADVNYADTSGWTALHYAARAGNVRMGEILLVNGSQPNPVKSDGWTPLHLASYNDRVEFVALLIEHGANPDVVDFVEQKAPKDLAKSVVVSRLLSGELRPEHLKIAGDLFSTIVEGDMERMNEFIKDQGSKCLSLVNEGGDSCLHIAAKAGKKEICRLLLDFGISPNARNGHGWTPLHHACREGHVEVARLLLERGANVNAAKDDQWSSLHLAAYNNHAHVISLLLEYEADHRARDKDGKYPLNVTTNSAIVEILLHAEDLQKGNEKSGSLEEGLEKVGLSEWLDRLKEAGLDSPSVMVHMTDDDMKELGMSLAERVKFRHCIRDIRENLEASLEYSPFDSVPDEFLCPITRAVMIDPVVTMDGHTYDRDAIARWLQDSDRSPMTNRPLSSKQLIPNLTLKKVIDDFQYRRALQAARNRKRDLESMQDLDTS